MQCRRHEQHDYRVKQYYYYSRSTSTCSRQHQVYTLVSSLLKVQFVTMMSFASVVSMILALLASYSIDLTTSFTTRPTFYLQSSFHCQNPSSQIGLLPELGTSISIALDVFDGSGVDPIVVSNVFWASFKAKLLSVIIGQLFATIVFGVVASFAASQLSTIGQFVTETIFKEQNDVKQVNTISTTKRTYVT